MNVVDALVISIGLDPTGFNKGRSEISSGLKKTGEEMLKTGKTVEASGKQMADALAGTARQLLGLYALFTAGAGIKEFTAQMTQADAALGRFAKNISVSPSTFSAYANAIERQGGSAAAAAASFQSLNDSLQDLRNNGRVNSQIEGLIKLQNLGGTKIDLFHGTPDQIAGQVNADLSTIRRAHGDAVAAFRGKEAGFDSDSVNFLKQDPAAAAAQLAESRRLGVANAASVKAAQELLTVFIGLQQASEDLGRTVLTALAPQITDLLKQLKEWVEANKEWLRTEITDRVREFAKFLAEIDWKAIGQGILEFAHDANDAAKAVGGWKNAIEIMFGLWLGSKFLAVMANIGMMRAALGLPGLIAAEGGALAYFGTAPYGNPGAQQGTGMTGLRKHQQDRNEDAGGPLGTVKRWGRGFIDWIKKPLIGGHAGGSGHSSGGWWTPDRQKEAFDYLTSRGMPSVSAIGLISRWKNVESTQGGPNALNRGSGAFGIMQGLGARKPRSADFHTQLDQVIREYQTGSGDGAYVKASVALAGAKSDADGAVAASAYERAEGYNQHRDGTDNFTGATLAGMAEVRRNVMGGSPGTAAAPGSALPQFHSSTPTLPGWHAAITDLKAAGAPLSPHAYQGVVGLRAAAAARRSGSSSSVTNSMSHRTHVGELHIHTPTDDPKRMATDMRKALQNTAYAGSANTGLK